METPQPSFARIDQNSMFIIDKKITDIQAKSLNQFLQTTKSNPSMIIRHLTLINCSVSDENLAVILEGIISQGNKLATFVYS
jgi:hypothetical protein